MPVDKMVYINIVIICVVSVIGFIFMSTIINIIGKKNILREYPKPLKNPNKKKIKKEKH